MTHKNKKSYIFYIILLYMSREITMMDTPEHASRVKAYKAAEKAAAAKEAARANDEPVPLVVPSMIDCEFKISENRFVRDDWREGECGLIMREKHIFFKAMQKEKHPVDVKVTKIKEMEIINSSEKSDKINNTMNRGRIDVKIQFDSEQDNPILLKLDGGEQSFDYKIQIRMCKGLAKHFRDLYTSKKKAQEQQEEKEKKEVAKSVQVAQQRQRRVAAKAANAYNTWVYAEAAAVAAKEARKKKGARSFFGNKSKAAAAAAKEAAAAAAAAKFGCYQPGVNFTLNEDGSKEICPLNVIAAREEAAAAAEKGLAVATVKEVGKYTLNDHVSNLDASVDGVATKVSGRISRVKADKGAAGPGTLYIHMTQQQQQEQQEQQGQPQQQPLQQPSPPEQAAAEEAAAEEGLAEMRTSNVSKYEVGQYVENMGVRSVSGYIVKLKADKGTTGPGTLTIQPSEQEQEQQEQQGGPEQPKPQEQWTSVVMRTGEVAKYRVGQYVKDLGNDRNVSGTVTSVEPDTEGAVSGPGRITVFQSRAQQQPQQQQQQQQQQETALRNFSDAKDDWDNAVKIYGADSEEAKILYEKMEKARMLGLDAERGVKVSGGSRKHKQSKHKQSKHKSRKHKQSKHKSRKHKQSKHKSRKHKQSKHKQSKRKQSRKRTSMGRRANNTRKNRNKKRTRRRS